MTTTNELQDFHFAFQITRKITLEVNYYRLSTNKFKHFATSANEFNQPKTDFSICGQAQKDLLSGKAMMFYKKWDKCHLNDITEDQHVEILKDIEVLKNQYNYIENDSNVNFDGLRALSMMKIKP
jgi:hypothetical protein